MASVRAGLETAPGRSLADWLTVADQCPDTRPKARQAWFKAHHGLGQSYFMLVERERAQARGAADPRDPQAAKAALWSDAKSAAVFQALKAMVYDLPDLITGQRKTYTTWSRSFAFACARAVKGGAVRLGLGARARRQRPASARRQGGLVRAAKGHHRADRAGRGRRGGHDPPACGVGPELIPTALNLHGRWPIVVIRGIGCDLVRR